MALWVPCAKDTGTLGRSWRTGVHMHSPMSSCRSDMSIASDTCHHHLRTIQCFTFTSILHREPVATQDLMSSSSSGAAAKRNGSTSLKGQERRDATWWSVMVRYFHMTQRGFIHSSIPSAACPYLQTTFKSCIAWRGYWVLAEDCCQAMGHSKALPGFLSFQHSD